MRLYLWSRNNPGVTWIKVGERHGHGWSNTLWRRSPWRVCVGWFLAAVAVALLTVPWALLK